MEKTPLKVGLADTFINSQAMADVMTLAKCCN